MPCLIEREVDLVLRSPVPWHSTTENGAACGAVMWSASEDMTSYKAQHGPMVDSLVIGLCYEAIDQWPAVAWPLAGVNIRGKLSSRYGSFQNIHPATMKFPTIAIALALVSGGNGFVAPNTGVSRNTALNQSLRNLIINEKPRSVSSGSTPPAAIPEIPLPPAPATPSESTLSKDEVRSLFELWNQALATGDSRIVASRYIEKPCLLPTVSDVPRTDYDS
ncbi:hypothetical protein THAOC_29431, partial [Thalassiosira oceanica]